MKKINCILLVDDSPADNEFHSIIIRKADVCNHIRIAEDGVKAIEYIKNSFKPGNEDEYPKANLIFLDINMPRMNGFEFLEAYHKLNEKYKTSIVIAMLTTSLNPEDRTRAMMSGEISDFENKPLTKTMLLNVIQKFFPQVL